MDSKIDVVNVVDDRLKLHSQSEIKTFKGSNVTFNHANIVGGNPTLGQNSFSIPMTPNNILDRQLILHSKWSLEAYYKAIGGVNAGQAAVIPGVDVSMASFPFQRLLGQSTLKLNGETIASFDVGNYIDEILNLHDEEAINEYSTCPSAIEKGFINRSDAFLTTSDTSATYNEKQKNFIPNGSYTFTMAGNRGGTPVIDTNGSVMAGITLADGDLITVTFTFETWEPLILPPSVLSQIDKDSGLFGLSNLSLDLSINASRVPRTVRTLTSGITCVYQTNLKPTTKDGTTEGYNWAFPAPTANTNPIQSMELLFKTMPNSPYVSVPKQVQWHSYNITPYYQSFDIGKCVMSNINFPSMPRKLMIFARPSGVIDSGKANYYYSTTNASVSLSGWNQGMLSSASQYNLFQMTVDSGYKTDWLNFQGSAYALSFAPDGTASGALSKKPLIGSPLVLTPGLSFPLEDGVGVGSKGNWSFTFDITVANNSGDGATTCMLYVVGIYDNIITIDPQALTCRASIPQLSTAQLENKVVAEKTQEEEMHENLGAGLLSRLGKQSVKSAKNRAKHY